MSSHWAGSVWWRVHQTSTRTNRDGTKVRYLQPAHNVRDPVRQTASTKMLYSSGRAELLDRAAIERLIGALTRLLGRDGGAQTVAGVPGLEFAESRPVGAVWLLDQLWRTLGVDTSVTRLLAGPRRPEVTERVLFALVANGALASSSKLAAAGWVSDDVHVPGLAEVSEDACYRAMDWLLQVEPTLARNVYDSVADLYNLEVDLLFFDSPANRRLVRLRPRESPFTGQSDHKLSGFTTHQNWRIIGDTTSTHFQIEQADEAVPRGGTGDRVEDPDQAANEVGFRTWRKSKDHRDDLPQVIIGMAVTRDGIPVRVWSWPGNTTDPPSSGKS